MDEQQKAMLLSSAMNQYIFNKIFQDHNDGKIFDADRWLADVEKLTSDSMFSISPEKQASLIVLLDALDDYAFDPFAEKEKEPQIDNGPKLVL